jgi:hypothetical protein
MKTTVKLLFFVILVSCFVVRVGAQSLPDSSQAKVPDSTQVEKAIAYDDQTSLPHVYPNPFENKLTISFPESLCGELIGSVKIYDLFTGLCVFEGNFKNRLDIETTSWREGMFAVRIHHDRGYEPAKVYHNR